MSHCRACLFPIDRKTESVVAVTPDDRVTRVTRRDPKISRPRIFREDYNGGALVNCVNDYCKHYGGLAVAFHVDCATRAAHFGSPLNKYRHCTEFAYQPTKEHQRRRRECIRNLIENSLSKTFGKLPIELWRIVSDDDDLINLYTLAEKSLKRQPNSYFSIDLTLPVWATYTAIDGVEYVGSLSHSQTAKAHRICENVCENKVLYISSDHLGIRQILTDPSGAILDDYHPAYWQTVSVENQSLHVTGDGYRLRKVVRKSSAQKPIFWSSPSLPTPLAFFHPGWGEGEIVARMRPLTFNEPDTTGYSICWAGTEMDAIQAHRNADAYSKRGGITNGERSEYEDMGDSKWTYHPIARDEYVKQVWLRDCTQYDTLGRLPTPTESKRFHYHISTPWGTPSYKGLTRNKRPSDMALALVTSKGRTIMAGYKPDRGFCPPNSPERKWRLVSETETHAPMTIFVALPTHGIPLFAAPKLSGATQKPPPENMPLSRMPNFNPLFVPHFSSASLENVTSVTVCKSKNVKDEGTIRHFDLEGSRLVRIGYEKVAGLLFKYVDGHEESVGCFRFDWAEPSIDTTGTKSLFVGEKPGRIHQEQPHVADVDIRPPKNETEWIWIELPWAGTLEWWFNPESLGTSISHVDHLERN
ncbi:hypothetical protein NW768_008706 [Fusarium equiseti]|uniref:Tol protein n=1 Tax=Fusarium equiseti TaxID=61235 RepID=A0ABQ8R524_FUSEQ|nr:hypothetical protein NW768_008706 [Fusarium equiseti]